MTYLLPKLRDIFFAALFFAVIGFGARLFNIDGDLGRHITLGNWMLHNGILTRDVFSLVLTGGVLGGYGCRGSARRRQPAGGGEQILSRSDFKRLPYRASLPPRLCEGRR
jgi:hypothetical protein